MVLEKLIDTLMRTAIEHAGAERGLLILPHGKEQRIASEARTGRDGVDVQLQHALVTPSDMPNSLLRYVIRTRESVILDDASTQNLFSQDEYVRQRRPRSALCLPLVKQVNLVGILYLENSLAPCVFTPKRLAMLELLASQAAISLDHARLYAELTQENSDRRKAEEALRASEERWRKLFENSSAGIALVTPDGRYIAANLALQKMLGYTEEELQRLTALEVTLEEDRAGAEAILAESAEGQRRNYRIEKRYRRKDGNVIWADVSSTLVPATGTAPAFFAAVVVDITERKRAEEELRESEQRLQDIVDNTTAVVFVKDLDLRYLLVNREFERLHQVQRDQIRGKTDFEIHPPVVAETVRANDRRVIEAGEPIQFEEAVPSLEGERVYVSAKFLLRDRTGKPYAVCGIATDITELKRVEELQARRARQAALRADIHAAFSSGTENALQAILQRSAEAIVRHLDGAFARIWTLNDRQKVLELQASAGLYTRLDGEHARVPVGKLKIGLIAQERKPHLTNDVLNDNRISHPDWAKQERMVSFAGYPLLVEGRLVGVLAMFARNFLGQDTLEALESVADTIAQGIERKWAEEEQRRSEAYLTQGERIGHTGSWGWHVGTGLVYWSKEHFRIFDYDPETTMPSYSLLMERIHPEDRFSFEEILNRAVRDKSDFEYDYRIVLPDRSIKFLRSVGQALVNPSGELEFIGTVMDITDLKRAEEMRAALAHERELFAQQRATELAKANEALRGCLDALASVPELDEFLGQVMAAITRQLGAASSTLRVRNIEQNTLPLELVFQNGRVMSPDEVKYPEFWQSVSLQEQRFPFFLDQPAAIIRILDPHSPMPDDYRSYLRELGVKTVLIIPLTSRGQANGRLTFRFTEERDFHPEELEIARALATQASLAIHLTRLAKSARQSAVLEERNQLAAEIHDALAQSFTGITMQLGVAGEQLAAKEGDPLCQIQRANEIAKFGLAEARRSILSLRSSAIEESGFTTTLQRLVEHSNVAGRLRCDFRSDNIPEESLPPRIQHELLRFAQEAISNAVRHAKPTVVSVTLRWDPPNLILQVKDNGSGISRASLEKSEGFGLRNMRTRASQIDGKLDIHTAAGHGTSIVLTVPIPS
jgi:PAS domain S-box-containing protein